MAKFDYISEEARESIVGQAAPLMAYHDSQGIGAPNESLILGPSLREEFLPLDAIKNQTPIAPQLTDQTVSIIEVPGEHAFLGAGAGEAPRAKGYVRATLTSSIKLGAVAPDESVVTAVSDSDLSARIHSALAWIDSQNLGDPVVRILSIPSYHVTALALHQGDTIIGVVALPYQRDAVFEPNRIYSLDDFKARLRDLPSAEGLTLSE